MSDIHRACIIDDDEIFVFGLRKMMEIAAFSREVIVFPNGEEALNYFTSKQVDTGSMPQVIFLDINMPVMDGWQFLDGYELIKAPNKIPIFLLSSSIDPADRKKSQSYKSVNDYLTKPINLETLKELSQKI